MGVRTGSLIVIVIAVAGVIAWADAPGRTQITVWTAPAQPPGDPYGGMTYGGYAPTTGALVTELRDVDIAGGDARITGVAASLDPASVQLRDVTDPTAQLTAQRFLPGAATPTEILTRHIGDPVSITTLRGEVSGALRAVDDQVIVVETGAGDARRLQVMRRDGFVQDIVLPPGGTSEPSLAWRVRTARPGKHTVELTYRADGMSWTADYLAVLDEAGRALDLTAWATIKNATGASFDAADVTLVGPGTEAVPDAHPPPARFHIAAPVRIGRGDLVQVELMPRRIAPVRSVILYEAMPDPSPQFQATPGIECNQFNGVGASNGHTEVALEIDVPGHVVLPDGKVRLYQRRKGRNEVVSEDALRTAAGVARLRVTADNDITGERHAVSCNADELRHTLHETIEVKIENRTARPADVVIREFLWRWPAWRIDGENHKGVRAGPQLQEYHVHVPASGRQVVTYTAVYSW